MNARQMLRLWHSATAILSTGLCVYLAVTIALAPLMGCAQNQAHHPTSPQVHDVAAMEARSARYEHWIAAMDPFVVQNPKTQLYEFNQAGFLSQLREREPRVASALAAGASSNEDASVIAELELSVSNGNAITATEQAGVSRQATPNAVQACAASEIHWWGKRICFWGGCADAAVASMAMGGLVVSAYLGWIPGVVVVLGGFVWWAQYLNDHCPGGGFCVCGSWAGGVWLTCR